jgi:hypothetical protein
MRWRIAVGISLVTMLCRISNIDAQPAAGSTSPIETIVRFNHASTPMPDGGLLSQFGGAQVNNVGDAAFLAKSDAAESFGIYVSTGEQLTGRHVSLVAITGDRVPGVLTPDGFPVDVVLVIPYHLFRLNLGVTAPSPNDVPVINDAREIAFAAAVDGGLPVLDIVLKWRNGRLMKVAMVGDHAPLGGVFAEILSPTSINASGDTVFRGVVRDQLLGDRDAIFVGNEHGVTTVVAAGDNAPGGGTFTTFLTDRGTPVYMPATINDRGDVLFWAALAGATAPAGLFLKSGETGAISTIALEGELAPLGGGYRSFVYRITRFGTVEFDNATGPRLNNSGEVVFVAFVEDPIESPARSAIFRWNAGTATRIAIADDLSFTECLVWSVDHPTINDRGAVAFRETVVCQPPSLGSRVAILEERAGTIRTVVSTDPEPTMPWSSLINPVLNDRGDVAFVGGASFEGVPFSGLFLALAPDRTPPLIASRLTPPPNARGWNKDPVMVEWVVEDPESGVVDSAGCDARLLTNETPGVSLTCSATNGTGLISSAEVTIAIDRTPPAIVFSDNAGTYTVDEIVNITCSATDALSGVATAICPEISRPAYAFPLGANTFSAAATDLADNSATETTGFVVQVTFASLANLTRQFASNAKVGEALTLLLDAASKQANHGNVRLSKRLLELYVVSVQHQIGISFTVEQAAVLVRLARAL